MTNYDHTVVIARINKGGCRRTMTIVHTACRQGDVEGNLRTVNAVDGITRHWKETMQSTKEFDLGEV